MAQKSLSCSDARELCKLLDRDHPALGVSGQCALLGLPRSKLYYQPIPLQRGFLNLVAIVDLFFRHVLSCRLSNSPNTEFCLEALEMALGGCRKPEVFHSDQGCQFTSSAFVARLQAEEIKISWSGRKRCYDNILVERLWRTVK